MNYLLAKLWSCNWSLYGQNMSMCVANMWVPVFRESMFSCGLRWKKENGWHPKAFVLATLLIVTETFRAATGAKNQRYESWTDEYVNLYLRTCSALPTTIHFPTIHSPMWKLKQNKCAHKCSKKGNTPRKWWFKSNQENSRAYLFLPC